MKTRASNIWAVLIVLALLVLAACVPTAIPNTPAAPVPTATGGHAAPVATSAPATKAPAAGGALVIGFDIEPKNFDIHVEEREHLRTMLRNVYETLVIKGTDGSLQPGLATSWQVSPDGLTYTFQLRRDVKFHDGTPFNAEAVKFNFDRIVDPATESRWAIQLLGPYDSTQVVDEYTARVKLKEPYGPFLEAATQVFLGMVSPTAAKKWGKEYYLHQVGTGPFLFKEYVAKDHLTLERNPNYNWAPSSSKHQGPPYLDQVTFKFIPENAPRLGTVQTGETSLVHTVDPREVSGLKSNSTLQVYVNSRASRARHYTLNVQKEPTDQLAVRQALNLAVNREQLVKTLFSDVYSPAYGHLGPNTLFYDAALEEEYKKKYAYDPAGAAKLLDSAGWVLGPDGVRTKDGKRLKIITIAGSQREVHELVQAQLKQVGFEVDFQLPPVPAFFAACDKGEANLCFLGGTAFPDPGLYLGGFFSIGGGYNWGKNDNAQLTALLKQGVTMVDPSKRQEVYTQAQRIILGDVLTLPLFYEKDIWVARTGVKNLAFDAFLDPVLYDVSIQK